MSAIYNMVGPEQHSPSSDIYVTFSSMKTCPLENQMAAAGANQRV